MNPSSVRIEPVPLKPLIRWAGGKQFLINQILDHAPQDSRVNRYFEPFLGAGSLFFSGRYSKSTLSDSNSRLIRMYEAVRDNPEGVHTALQKYLSELTPELYYKLRATFNRKQDSASISQAARFIFLLQTSFNGIYRLNAQGHYNVPVGKLEPQLPSLTQLRAAAAALRSVTLRATDYRKAIQVAKKNDFVYFDPPYFDRLQPHGYRQFTAQRFKLEDHELLAEHAAQLSARGCRVLISNSDTPEIRKLFRKWKIFHLTTRRTVGGQKIRLAHRELIIRNYDI